jgi:mono/diheme cytochrome c family protein
MKRQPTVQAFESVGFSDAPQRELYGGAPASEGNGDGAPAERVRAFSPPEGSVPAAKPAAAYAHRVGEPPGGQALPWLTRMMKPELKLEGVAPSDAVADALRNPREADSLESLENGRKQYEIFCTPCHGGTGDGIGPVALKFGGVPALIGADGRVRGRSDGSVYTTIRYGRGRMPPYSRIAIEDRWDIVNYVRYLDRKTGGQP